jgi:predicted NUDIX family phosphoesterase
VGKMDEKILVAPRQLVFNNEQLTFQGVNSDTETVKQIVKNMSDTYSVMRRGDAEEDPTYKQPIPYAVIKRGNQVFAYRRLSGGGEARLHNQISFGVGGHCNQIEGLDFYALIAENLRRELNEELVIKENSLTLETVGLINDDENEVGKVHLGMLVIGELKESEDVSVRETDQLEGFWINIDELKDVYEDLETWSQFVADILIK